MPPHGLRSATITIKNTVRVPIGNEILMPTFRLLIFWDVSLVGRYEFFTPLNQRNNSAVETADFAVTTLLI